MLTITNSFDWYDDKNEYFNLVKSIDNRFITKLNGDIVENNNLFELTFDIDLKVNFKAILCNEYFLIFIFQMNFRSILI